MPRRPRRPARWAPRRPARRPASRRSPTSSTATAVTRLYRADDAGPAGRRRDAEVDDALPASASRRSSSTSPTCAALGSLRTGTGTPFKVFTPYWRRVAAARRRPTVRRPDAIRTVDGVRSDGDPRPRRSDSDRWRPQPGEQAAHRAARSIPALVASTTTASTATCRRTTPPAGSARTSSSAASTRASCCTASTSTTRAHETFAQELAWRDFYADVLHAWPESAWTAFNADSPSIQHRPVPCAERTLRRMVRRPHRRTRSSTPACASSSPRASCTTGCG